MCLLNKFKKSPDDSGNDCSITSRQIKLMEVEFAANQSSEYSAAEMIDEHLALINQQLRTIKLDILSLNESMRSIQKVIIKFYIISIQMYISLIRKILMFHSTSSFHITECFKRTTE